MDSSGSGQEQVAGCCENDNELLGSIKYEEFLDQLRICQLFKKSYFRDYVKEECVLKIYSIDKPAHRTLNTSYVCRLIFEVCCP
jgi:hypothetical protein